MPKCCSTIPKLVVIFLTLTLGACGGSNDNDSGSGAAVTTFSELNKGIYTGDTYKDSEVSTDSNGDEIVRTKLTQPSRRPLPGRAACLSEYPIRSRSMLSKSSLQT